MASSPANGLHILIFPFPAQGHILPILDFTHQISLRGLTITVLITPKNLPILDPLLSAHPSIQTLILPFPGHHSIPSGVENVKDLGNRGNAPMVGALSRLSDPIIQWFSSHPNPPAALISDFFLGWTHDLARRIGIPRIVFYPSGAFSTAAMQFLWLSFDSINRSMGAVTFSDLPRSPSFVWDHLPSVFRRNKESSSSPDSLIVRNGMIANSSSWGAVFNSFEELEGEYLGWWRTKMDGNVFTMGPLNQIGVPDRMGRGNADSSSSSDNNGGVLKWLDACPDGLVLYVCFGSQVVLKKAQMEALANGLEQSGVRFVWVTKPLTAQQLEDGYWPVPDGFQDRVSGNGLIVKGWAPQVAILNHPAVGGFLSHFGMNSMLEAIVAGVMVLGWPMEADQFLNERLLVDYIGAAVRVCQGLDTVPDPAAFARIVNDAMRKDAPERERAKELRNKALQAVENGGSSIKDLDKFVEELAQFS